jgi:hypothetical protein
VSDCFFAIKMNDLQKEVEELDRKGKKIPRKLSEKMSQFLMPTLLSLDYSEWWVQEAEKRMPPVPVRKSVVRDNAAVDMEEEP